MHNDSHGLVQTIATDATIKDYSTALANAIGDLMITRAPEATICVPHFMQAGHPWTLSRGAHGGWQAERGPSDDPENGEAARMTIEFGDTSLEAIGELMLINDQAHPFVVDWGRREALALAA